jgi:hypothetical protein
MARSAVSVVCVRCRKAHAVTVSSLLFSFFHLLDLFMIECPHCGRFALHTLGKSDRIGKGLRALGGPDDLRSGPPTE